MLAPTRFAAPGLKLDGYILRRALGGQGSTVFEADAPDGARVVVKVASNRLPELSDRVRLEARALRALQGPGVVQLLDSGTSGPWSWFAERFVPGHTFASWLETRPGADQVLRVASELAQTLTRLHAAGWVHRDLSPTNVLCGPTTTLIDFGISRRLSDGLGRAPPDFRQASGTPGFAAPEQVAKNIVDPRCDLFSLGVLLFLGLGGRRSVAGVPQIDTLGTGCDPRLAALLTRLLATRLRDRPSSATEVVDGLEAVVSARPAPARSPVVVFQPPLIGRSQESALLERTVRRAALGAGVLISLRGEPGSGKTALAIDLAQQVGADFAVHSVALSDEADLLRFESSLAPATHEGEPLQARALRLREALAARTTDQPVLLILDEPHDCGAFARRFLEALQPSWVRRWPLAVVSLRRPEDDVGPSVPDLELELPLLTPDETARFVSEALALPEAPASVLELVRRSAAGSPLSTLEFLRLLTATGRLERTGAGGVMLRWASDTDVPGSLVELARQRLNGLEANARRALAELAVLGSTFTEDEAALLPNAPRALLDQLVARSFLRGDRHGRYRFAHDSLLRAATELANDGDRRELHARLAQGTGRLAFFRARHAHLAGLSAETFSLAALAAQEARQRGSVVDEVAALEWRSSTAPADWPAEERAALQLELSRALSNLGDTARSTVAATASLGHLGVVVEVPPHHLVGPVARAGLSALWRWVVERPARSRHALAASAAMVLTERAFYSDDAPRLVLLALLTTFLAQGTAVPVPLAQAALGGLAGFMRAHRFGRASFHRARQTRGLTRPDAALVDLLEALNFANGGRWLEARALVLAALGRLDPHVDGRMLRLALTTRGHLEFFTGDVGAALESSRQVLDSAIQEGSTQHATWARFSIARSLRRLGRHDEAHHLLLEAASALEQNPERQSEVICLGLLSASHVEDGRPERAREPLRRVLGLIGSTPPTSFVVLEAYLAALHAMLALEDPSLGTPRLLEACRRLSWTFPVAGAGVHLARGLVASASGATHQARLAYQKAQQSAASHGMLLLEADAARALRALTP